MLASTPVYPNSGNRSKIMVCRRWSLPMPPVVPAHRPVQWDGIHISFTSIPVSHRLQHNCLNSYTRGWVWCAIFPDNIAVIELRISVRKRHLSGGRSAVNRALSSYVQIHPHPFDEQQNPYNPQSKSHPYEKCTTRHHTRTSQSIARGQGFVTLCFSLRYAVTL
jgi:hypothetical protein